MEFLYNQEFHEYLVGNKLIEDIHTVYILLVQLRTYNREYSLYNMVFFKYKGKKEPSKFNE